MKRFTVSICLAALFVGSAWWIARPNAASAPTALANSSRVPGRDPERAPLDTPALAPTRRVTEPIEALPDAAKLAPEPTRLARVFGTIEFVELGGPAVGCEVIAFGDGQPTVRTTTGPDGAFELALSPGTRFVGAAPEDGHAWCERIELAPGEERRLDHAFGALGDLCVRVWSDAPTGLERLAAAKISIVQADPHQLGGIDAAAELSPASWSTDAQGEATATTSDLSAYVVYVSAAGHVPSVVDLDFNPFLSSRTPTMYDGCLNVVLEQAGAEIHGIVVDDAGAPLGGAIVFASARKQGDPKRLEVGERRAPGVLSRRPPFARTDREGKFKMRLPLKDELDIVALPRRTDLVHHFARALDPAELRAPITIQIPEAWELELEFVDARGTALEGVASVRDLDGRAHFPPGSLDDLEFTASGAGRVHRLDRGRLRMIHAGGAARIGLSPNGVWRAGEVEIEIPKGARDRAVRVTIP